MKLYLVQHANQVAEEIDEKEPLSEKGRSDCEKVAQFVQKTGVNVESIFHSVKLRAKQTAEIFGKYLNITPDEKEGLKAMDDVSMWPDKITSSGDLMLVGHLPFMQKLSSLLLCGDQEKPIITFHQGGIVCLEYSENNWSIQYSIIPEVL